MFSLQNLSFRHNREIFRDLNFSVQPGEFIHLTGPNGSGKTSLLRALAGLVPSVFPGELKGKILFQRSPSPVCLTGPWAGARLFCRTVWEEVTYSPGASESEAEKLLEYFGLGSLKREHPQFLSGGQQQLVLLIAYLSTLPNLILLDECFSQLSQDKRTLLVSLLMKLHQKGSTIVLVEHQLPSPLKERVRTLSLHKGSPLGDSTDPPEVFPGTEIPSLPGKDDHPFLSMKELFTPGIKGEGLRFDDLILKKGEICHVAGAIGSGKTTLFKLLGGVRPYTGSVDIQGRELQGFKRKELVRKVGLALQDPDRQFFKPTVGQEIGLSSSLHDEEQDSLCRYLRLNHLLDQNPYTLSHGEKKRCQLATALAMDPDLLLLDEPDAGLDHTSLNLLASMILRLLRKGKSVMFTSHSQGLTGLLSSAGISPRVYKMRDKS